MRVDEDILHFAGFDTGFFLRRGGGNISLRQHFGTCHWDLYCMYVLVY